MQYVNIGKSLQDKVVSPRIILFHVTEVVIEITWYIRRYMRRVTLMTLKNKYMFMFMHDVAGFGYVSKLSMFNKSVFQKCGLV